MVAKHVFMGLLTVSALLICGGCTGHREVRFHDCERRMEQSGLCTLAGTSKERLLSEFGQPDDVRSGPGGLETLHYRLLGTLTTIRGLGVKRRDVEENVYIYVENDIIAGGLWEHYDGGMSRW
ncbi:MAG: hypothetical protein IH624_04055 [Phycisphaerae bacterium]|nr:hypothetical protein [Phycisphaerae bacterium]